MKKLFALALSAIMVLGLLSGCGGGGDTTAPDTASNSAATEEALVERIALRSAIHALPEQEQQTILLRFYRGLTQQQCARILGVSQVQVSRLEKRALERLRRDMG